MKVHHPAEFMAAVISNQGGFYSAFTYASETRRLGVSIQPPDSNASEIRWRGKDRHVRVGLLSIMDLGAETAQRIVAMRPYQFYVEESVTLRDVIEQNKDEFEKQYGVKFAHEWWGRNFTNSQLVPDARVIAAEAEKERLEALEELNKLEGIGDSISEN